MPNQVNEIQPKYDKMARSEWSWMLPSHSVHFLNEESTKD